ncbi:MAG: MFS transporter, partial [SAR86 cluster bacterium]
SQFFGAFCGGLMGGIIYGQFGVFAIFWLVAGTASFWLLFALSMRVPRQLKSYLINIGVTDQAGAIASADQLSQVAGVEEVVAVAEEGVAYLKVNLVELDEEALEKLSSRNAAGPDAIHS